MTDPQEQLRHRLRAISSASDPLLDELVAYFTPQSLEAHAYLLEAGETPTRLAFIGSGVLRMFYVTLDGDEFTKSFCMAGEFVTSYSALILREPSHLSIRAEQPTHLLMVDFHSLDTRFGAQLWWQQLARHLIERLYIKKEQRERQLLLKDATARYLDFLQDYPDLDTQVKQYQIASYLGITPVSLSRIRAQMRRD